MEGSSPSWKDLEAAFSEHHGQVYRFLLRRTGNHHEAEELTGRVFLEAAEALATQRAQPRSILAWLYTVAERRFIDELRRRETARRRLSLVPSPPPGESLYSRQVSAALRDAIEQLPEDQRVVVIRKAIRGEKFAEIAGDLGITVEACKMRMSRAVGRVRKTLEQYDLQTDE